MTDQPQLPVKAIATSFRIIEELLERDGAGAAELGEILDMPKSTVHDHLHTMNELEYLVNHDGRYYLGARFLELGGYAQSQMPLYQVARPQIEKLANTTGKQANLLIEQHGQGIFLYIAKGENATNVGIHLGKRVYLHTTAAGKALLSQFPEEEVDEIFDHHGLPGLTENTITDMNELKTQLVEIRKRGYAIDEEEHIIGMKCVAAPISGLSNEPLGAVSVSGPTNRFDGELLLEHLPKRVRSTANIIEDTIIDS